MEVGRYIVLVDRGLEIRGVHYGPTEEVDIELPLDEQEQAEVDRGFLQQLTPPEGAE